MLPMLTLPPLPLLPELLQSPVVLMLVSEVSCEVTL